MFKHGFIRVISIVISMAVLCFCMPFAAFAAGRGDTVRVGVSPVFGITTQNGAHMGYAYDYLCAISSHTGHRYSYVEASPDELMRMLDDGLIDVIPCVTESEYDYWANKYFTGIAAASAESVNAVPELCDVSVMRKYTAIYVDKNNKEAIGFFDTEALNKADIGYLADYKDNYFVDGRFVRGDIENANFIEYQTEAQMKNDFYSGNIDAVIKSCFLPWENEQIVYQYETHDCYMLVSGDDTELKAQLDLALNSVYMADSMFAYETYTKNIEKHGSVSFAFSNSEKAYIESNPVITVAYNESASPIENYDSASGRINGYTDTVLRHISDTTGFRMVVKSCASLEECVSLLADGKADVICGGANTISVAEYGNFLVSFPYTSAPIVTVGKQGALLTGSPKVAIPYKSGDINDYAAATFTNATLLPHDSAEACLQAVENGDVDIACADLYEAVYLLSTKYDKLSVMSSSTTNHLECFVFNTADHELKTIFGKCITSLGSKQLVTSYSDTIAAANSAPSSNTVHIGALYAVGGVLAVVLIGVVLLMLINATRNRRAGNIDTLTGGRNKHAFIEDTRKLFKKDPTDRWAIVLFDINKFKFVNDRLGYEEGDRMLERLYRTIADDMEDDEVFARISDDNFACTVRSINDGDITTRFNAIFAEFERRNSIFVKYSVIFSAGVCRLYQCRTKDNDVDVNAALDRCTIAKKTLKSMHYSSIAFYDGKIRDKALREKDYENVMPTALEQHEFECYLQPKYGLKSRRIEGAEALIRWNSKEFGFVFPNDFIPISEKNGFVVELDFFILEEVCKAIRRWLDEGKTPIVVSVNQSRLHLNYDDYIWRLREIVDKYDVPYKYIELEITESVFMEDTDKLLAIAKKLHEIGFKLSLDDFGSGYSSLNMLKDMPVDVVKIDREFFNGTVNSERGRAVISTVVDLAKNLDMQVISEGVETLEQVEFLTEINCAMVQGYYFAKPMTMDAFEELWRKELEKHAEN